MDRKDVTIRTTDGSGTFSAFLAAPRADSPVPAIIVIQEIFGVNKNMRDICVALAEAGYMAICPDLFWRQQPGVQLTDKTDAEWKRAFELYQGFDVTLGVEDLKATLAHIRRDKNCTGKAGTIGYCLGGKLAYLMATRSDADCNISYYGVGIEDLLDEAKSISTTLLLHIAGKDQFVPPAAQKNILQALKGRKNIETHVYPGADHAFARINGQHYDKNAAHKANDYTSVFLEAYLTGS